MNHIEALADRWASALRQVRILRSRSPKIPDSARGLMRLSKPFVNPPPVKRWLGDDSDLSLWETPVRGGRGVADLVVFPGDVEEVKALISWAKRGNLRLLPQGANSGLVGASTPSRDSLVVVSMDHFELPLPIEVEHKLVTVPAGMRLSQLNAMVKPLGLCLPIDLAADPAIGGMVATNTGGSRAMLYGPMERHIMGVQAVIADVDCTVIGSTTSLTKDSRGVNLGRIQVGSGVTLGIITAVSLALTALPKHTDTWWLALTNSHEAHQVLTYLEGQSPALISAFERIAGRAFAVAVADERSKFRAFDGQQPESVALVEWSIPGSASKDPVSEEIAPQDIASLMAGLYDEGLISDARQVPPQASWEFRHNVSAALSRHGDLMAHDISVPRASLAECRQQLCALASEVIPEAEVCDFGHAGDGGLHFNLVVPHGLVAPPAWVKDQFRSGVAQVVGSFGGSYSAEHGLGQLNAQTWFEQTPVGERHLMSAIKQAVDPDRILGHPGHPYNQSIS